MNDAFDILKERGFIEQTTSDDIANYILKQYK